MNVYFVRHGESLGNKEQKAQTFKSPLSLNGKRQAKEVAKRLKNIPIDILYSSPYVRAKQTAEIIAKELEKPVEYWEELRERKRPTEIEGFSIFHPNIVKIGKHIRKNQIKPDWRYSDDESFNDLLTRAQKVIDHLLTHHYNQNILCVSHSGIMKMIVLSAILKDKITPEVFWQLYYQMWSGNTGITHLEYTQQHKWGLMSWNDTRHL